MSDVTVILQAMGRGEERTLDELLPLVYEELRHLAASRMAQESAGHTLQPTALVHEAYMRLAAQRTVGWDNRGQLMALAARMMRRVLLDQADACVFAVELTGLGRADVAELVRETNRAFHDGAASDLANPFVPNENVARTSHG